MKSSLGNIAVYCGSSSGASPAYRDSATKLGQAMLARNIGLVYGGASIGVMGQIADTVLQGGGQVTGVIPEALAGLEIAHSDISELIVVRSMHERKALMAERADGFIALPGGLGTMEELFEVLTWAQLGMHNKPCAMLNVNGYYDSLVGLLDTMVEQGFVKPLHRELLLVENEVSPLLDRMQQYRPPKVDKIISKAET
ncbi:MAG: TIGR00730 family Rossman fold protein [Pseudomonadota bacterium]